MIALALYVVPRTSQKRLYSIGRARLSLYLINCSVLLGTILLLLGVSNVDEMLEFITDFQIKRGPEEPQAHNGIEAP
jgi:cytochrome c oxidase cbb3-type subunit 1